MANNFITMLQAKCILQMLINGDRKLIISKGLKISLNTVKKYIKLFEATGMSYNDLLLLPDNEFVSRVYPVVVLQSE